MYPDAAVYCFNEAQVPQAEISMRSCNHHMPGLPIIQMSPHGTPVLPLTDHFVQMHGVDQFPWSLFRSYTTVHQYTRRAFLLHTDVVVLRDLRPLMPGVFDVALPLREEKEMMGAYPDVIYQSGALMVSKSREFWRSLYYDLNMNKPFDWENGKFDVLFHAWLREKSYVVNPMMGVVFTPDQDSKPHHWKDAWVLHYEAKARKKMMINRWENHRWT